MGLARLVLADNATDVADGAAGLVGTLTQLDRWATWGTSESESMIGKLSAPAT